MWKIINGNNIDVLRTYEANTFDSVVTDPPYGIAFLNKSWDSDTGALETWQECFRVLKPGGHLLAFSAARTYHHLATNIEQSGFEIRDQLMWLYGSGFPKAQDIGKAIQKRQGVKETKPVEDDGAGRSARKRMEGGGHNPGYSGIDTICTSPEAQQWSGWKTALKPAHEPIVMARKPFSGSTIDNVLEHGVGALNIDASRIGNEEITTSYNPGIKGKMAHGHTPEDNKTHKLEPHTGRFPSNVLGEVPNYQKFFYCPKVSRAERHAGFEQLPKRLCGHTYGWQSENQGNTKKHDPLGHIPKDSSGMYVQDENGKCLSERYEERVEKQRTNNLSHIPAPFGDVTGCYVDGKRFAQKHQDLQKGSLDHIPTTTGSMWDVDGTGIQYNANKHLNVGNNHPTVKPVELMKYLVRLVTPKGGRVLDPFNGSGSTGMACVELGYDYVGVELDENYVEIAEKRIGAWEERHKGFSDLFDENT